MRLRRLLIILSLLGPGLISAMIDNDASGITTYSVAGARYGYALMWTMIPTAISLIVVQEMVARMGVITGKGLSDLIRENYGVKTAVIMLFCLFIANLGTTVANFSGLAASLEIFNMSKYAVVPLGAILVWMLISKGNYRFVEKVLLIACLVYVGYAVSCFMAKPQWQLVLKDTIVPVVKLDSEYIMLSIAVIGTTITPWMQFYLQSSVVEKGLRKEDFHISRIEIIVGSIITIAIGYFILITCGTLLYPHGIRINEAAEAAMALKPFAGEYATLIFTVSLANASLLGAIIVPLATSYYMCEAMGWESGVGKTYKEAPQFMLIYTVTIFFAALMVVIPGMPLVSLMVTASFINGILLPFVLIYAILLINKQSLMGEYTNSKVYNVIAWATVIVLIILSVILIFSILF
ncbi:MAG: Nramp family divalent metal transporter [Candidatus Magnetoovum sp. WYHC-5]|nr:Nramp family divalent metal transporter [Candidatus Magnetoovum sp. WYHC-5]